MPAAALAALRQLDEASVWRLLLQARSGRSPVRVAPKDAGDKHVHAMSCIKYLLLVDFDASSVQSGDAPCTGLNVSLHSCTAQLGHSSARPEPFCMLKPILPGQVMTPQRQAVGGLTGASYQESPLAQAAAAKPEPAWSVPVASPVAQRTPRRAVDAVAANGQLYGRLPRRSSSPLSRLTHAVSGLACQDAQRLERGPHVLITLQRNLPQLSTLMHTSLDAVPCCLAGQRQCSRQLGSLANLAPATGEEARSSCEPRGVAHTDGHPPEADCGGVKRCTGRGAVSSWPSGRRGCRSGSQAEDTVGSASCSQVTPLDDLLAIRSLLLFFTVRRKLRHVHRSSMTTVGASTNRRTTTTCHIISVWVDVLRKVDSAFDGCAQREHRRLGRRPCSQRPRYGASCQAEWPRELCKGGSVNLARWALTAVLLLPCLRCDHGRHRTLLRIRHASRLQHRAQHTDLCSHVQVGTAEERQRAARDPTAIWPRRTRHQQSRSLAMQRRRSG